MGDPSSVNRNNLAACLTVTLVVLHWNHRVPALCVQASKTLSRIRHGLKSRPNRRTRPTPRYDSMYIVRSCKYYQEFDRSIVHFHDDAMTVLMSKHSLFSFMPADSPGNEAAKVSLIGTLGTNKWWAHSASRFLFGRIRLYLQGFVDAMRKKTSRVTILFFQICKHS